MKNKDKKFYQLAEKNKKNWPQPLIKALEKYWHNTIKDDEKGLISGIIFTIIPRQATKKQINMADHLAAAALYRWTAANLQDDIFDNKKVQKINLPLALACLNSAEQLSFTAPLSQSEKKFLYKLYLQENNANFLEIRKPKIIPKGKLSPSNKSLFLLLSPLHFALSLNWSKYYIQLFLKAGRYLLTAKQLADDVYDYREDWRAGRRNFAHRGLKRLPSNKELPLYYRQQALIILKLCKQCRKIIKKISPLTRKNSFDFFLDPLEINCQRTLAKINQRA